MRDDGRAGPGVVGDSGGGRGRRASAHRSITFRAVFGFQCCVSLSCGVLKHVPCTLLPHSYALVLTTRDVRLPPPRSGSALRSAHSALSVWVQRVHLASWLSAGRSSALGGAVVPPWVDQSPRRLFPHGNPRPTPRLQWQCPGARPSTNWISVRQTGPTSR